MEVNTTWFTLTNLKLQGLPGLLICTIIHTKDVFIVHFVFGSPRTGPDVSDGRLTSPKVEYKCLIQPAPAIQESQRKCVRFASQVQLTNQSNCLLLIT